MIFQSLAKRIFRKRVRKHQLSTPRNSMFVNYNRARKVLLLFESHYSEKNTETKRLIEQLQSDGKSVIAWGYVDKRKPISPEYPDYKILGNGDLDITGRPRQAFLKELTGMEFDLVIDVSRKAWLPLSYLLLYSNAPCKAGMKKEGVQLYDFAVDVDELLAQQEKSVDDMKFSFLFEHIIFYLKNIQTTDY